jgi:hypothetical protein
LQYEGIEEAPRRSVVVDADTEIVKDFIRTKL